MEHKYFNLLKAILKTGDGTSEKMAYSVISVSHEYEILIMLGLKFAGSQELIGSCDYLLVKENDKNIEGVYFDVSRLFEIGFGGKPESKSKKKKKKKK